MAVIEGTPEPVVDQAIDELLVPKLDALPVPLQVVGRIRHRLHPSSDHHLFVTSPDRLCSEHYRLEARATDPTHRHRADPLRDATRYRCLTCRGLAEASGDDIPRSEGHTSELQSRGHLVC